MSEISLEEILKTVRAIEVKTRRKAKAQLSGAYHSAFKGRGIEFEEVREYVPGDDVRFIDWKVTARMDKPFVKTFREDREMTFYLVVDCSSSFQFGTGQQSKRRLLAELASTLAFSATSNQDKIGLILYTDKIEHHLPPRKGRSHILRLIRDVLYFPVEGKKTDTVQALQQLQRLQKKPAAVFLLTDFLQEANGELSVSAEQVSTSMQQSLRLLGQQHDFVCCSIHDQLEKEFPDLGWVLWEDRETGAMAKVNTSSVAERKRIDGQNAKRLEQIKKMCRRAGVDHLPFFTNEDFTLPLKSYFERRGHL